MGSTRRIIQAVGTFGGSEIKRDLDRKKREREAEAAESAKLAQQGQEEKVEAIPTLQDVEVEDAGRRVRRRIQQGAGRRSTILSNRRVALGGSVLALGDRPISRPTLGGT